MRSERKGTIVRWLRVGGSTGLLLAAAPLSSSAGQHDSPVQFWLNNDPETAPRREPARPHIRPAPRAVDIRPSGATSVARPRIKPDFVVAIFGDAFGADLARGLTDAYAATPSSQVDDRTKDGTNLSSLDPDAWGAAIETVRKQTGRLDAAAILLGTEDWQPVRNDHGGREEPGSPAWRQIWGDHVERLAGVFRDKHVPLIWVGIPIVRDGDAAKSFADLNAIIRDRAPKASASYVDSWEAFTDDNGQYSATGPDLNGQTATLRRSDGWDFTRAGARKLASFIEADLKREQDRAAAAMELAAVPTANPDTFDQALNIDVNAQIRREAGLTPEASQVGPSSPPADAQPPVPKAGPILALTAPPITPGGTLAEATSPSPPIEFARMRETQGVNHAARADDFTWPRP